MSPDTLRGRQRPQPACAALTCPGVQAEMAEEATTTVHKLRRAVQAGEATEEELQRAEGMLAQLSGSLQYLHGEMNVTMRGARRAFRHGFGDGSESDVRAPCPPEPCACGCLLIHGLATVLCRHWGQQLWHANRCHECAGLLGQLRVPRGVGHHCGHVLMGPAAPTASIHAGPHARWGMPA